MSDSNRSWQIPGNIHIYCGMWWSNITIIVSHKMDYKKKKNNINNNKSNIKFHENRPT